MSQQNISLALAFLQNHPGSAASILETHEAEDVATFLSEIPHTYAISVMQHMLPQKIAYSYKHMAPDTAATTLSRLSVNHGVAVLRLLEKTTQTSILNALPKQKQVSYKLLLHYSKDMVGAWMTPHVASVPTESTVQEAIDSIKKNADINYSDYLFVVDREQQFRGRIRFSALLCANPTHAVSSIVEEHCPKFYARTLIKQITNAPDWQKNDAIPILNKNRQFIGVLRHFDLRRSIEQSSQKETSTTDETPFTSLFQLYGHTLNTLWLSMKHCIESDIRS